MGTSLNSRPRNAARKSLHVQYFLPLKKTILNSLGPFQCSRTTGLRHAVGREFRDVATVIEVDVVGVELVTVDQNGQSHQSHARCHRTWSPSATPLKGWVGSAVGRSSRPSGYGGPSPCC